VDGSILRGSMEGYRKDMGIEVSSAWTGQFQVYASLPPEIFNNSFHHDLQPRL
jgi:hypothetical protein